MARQKHPMRKLAEVKRKQKACGTLKESKELRRSPAEVPSSSPSPSGLPHYLRKLLQAGPLKPGLTQVIVEHDSWCATFHGGTCNCDPTVTTRREDDVH